MTVPLAPAVREAGRCGERNNEHTLFSRWAGSAPQTMSPSLLSSTLSDNDRILQRRRSPSLMTYMGRKCASHDELQEDTENMRRAA